MENTKRLSENIIEVKICHGVMAILHLLLEMRVKKLPDITYGIRVDVDAYIP